MKLFIALALIAVGMTGTVRERTACERGPTSGTGLMIGPRALAVEGCTLRIEKDIPHGHVVKFRGTSDGKQLSFAQFEHGPPGPSGW